MAYIMETLLVRRRLFDFVGLHDPDLPTGSDVDWYARAFDVASSAMPTIKDRRISACMVAIPPLPTAAPMPSYYWCCGVRCSASTSIVLSCRISSHMNAASTITAITPVYNGERYLAKAIGSVLD